MPETFLFDIAESLLKKISSVALQEVLLASGLETHLEKLEETLSDIKVVQLDAEQQGQNLKVKVWLQKLKQVLYEAEDVLDEIECETLRRQVVKDGGSIGRKVCRFFSSSNPLAFRFRMGHKIKKIQERVVEIAAQKSNFDLTARVHNDRPVLHRERETTHSFVLPSDVIGREEDKEKIIRNLLLHHDHGENVSVIPIVGMGGLGKTTLAKLVYNDYRIVTDFQLRMWVCVSLEFDLQKVVVKVLKSATGQDFSNLDMDQLQRIVRDTLDDRKYLLVLDDIWIDDPRRWFELKHLLIGGGKGTKIIVTTRSNHVASIVGTISAYNLAGLPHKESLSLFFKCTFREEQEKLCSSVLARTGEEIVKKCKGVPLAILTLGTLLYSKIDERDWKLVRDSEMWKLEQKDNDILPALRLSYEQLPLYLKRCFAYCSVFPKHYEFLDVALVQFWMAHGLLQSSNENEGLEDVGFRYLKELRSRCFFQDFRENCGIVTCKMHDLVHDLALSVAQYECSRVTSASQHIPKSIRHLSFPEPESLPEDLPLLLHSLDHVRTIFFLSETEGLTSRFIFGSFFSRFEYLRALDLTDSQFEVLPRKIGRLKHLRYLNLSWNLKIKRLPNSICKLQNLETLILHGCHQIEELPRNLRHMISLRCLYITTKQKYLPMHGIGNLKSLRFLGLLYCENLEYLFEDMKCLESLRALVLWSCDSLISLPQSIKHLTALETLIIAGCENLSFTMEEGKNNGDFSQLRLAKLVIAFSPKVVDFPGCLLSGSSNTLKFLEFKSCPNLRELPSCLQSHVSLQELWIENCPKLKERCMEETSADWPKISHIPIVLVDGVNVRLDN